MKDRIIIIGAGGHGKVVADALLQRGEAEIAGFIDEKLPAGSHVMAGLTVLGSLESLATHTFDGFIVAIGDNERRSQIFDSLSGRYRPATVIHPFSSVSPLAEIGAGTVILAGAVVSCGARVGQDCIIGSCVHIDHESTIGDHTYLRAGTCIGSNCAIPAGFLTDTGDVVASFTKMDEA